MLKSTHKPQNLHSVPLLPDGWAEHKAPTGHPYYYNAGTRVSTYVRPQQHQYSDSSIPANAQQPNVNAEHQYPNSWDRSNEHSHQNGSRLQSPPRGRGMYGHQQRSQGRDRPKSKHAIPGWEPWVLVKTKVGRRFVHNADSNESFWKFPPDVLKGVVEYDRQEREKRQKLEHDISDEVAPAELVVPMVDTNPAIDLGAPTAAPRPDITENGNAEVELDSDEEYEEVEVTDDEDEQDMQQQQTKQDGEFEQPIEFNEDDIAYQLAAMGQDYGLDPGEYGDDDQHDLEEGAEGLALTEDDSKALFKDMLNDYQINPYSTWDALVEAGQIMEDDRYTVLPSMRSRREVWGEWSKDRIQQLKEQHEKEEKKDPKIPYFAFLEARATLKLYWPEFRRKYQKEPEMRNSKLLDKDREKWYREYISRLKLPESTLKSDFVQLLKSQPIHVLNNSTVTESLPSALLTDLRFISLRNSVRDPLLKAHISSLPPAPTSSDISPADAEAIAKEKAERERREQALAERQRRAQEEKRKQEGALRYGRGVLREEERELERAMKVSKQGLLSHRQAEGAQG